MKAFQLSGLRVRKESITPFVLNLRVAHRTVRMLMGIALVSLMVLAMGGTSPSAAATILVNDDADGPLPSLAGDGKCQLREAIEAANNKMSVDSCIHDGSSGLDTIVFDL